MNAKQTMRQGRRPPLKHCLLSMAALLLAALAALLPHSAPAGEPMRIRLIVDGETLPAVLEDNPAGRDFLSMLPLTLTVKDYNGTEKIGNPPREIATEGMPDSIEPSAGRSDVLCPVGQHRHLLPGVSPVQRAGPFRAHHFGHRKAGCHARRLFDCLRAGGIKNPTWLLKTHTGITWTVCRHSPHLKRNTHADHDIA